MFKVRNEGCVANCIVFNAALELLLNISYENTPLTLVYKQLSKDRFNSV